MTEWNKTRLGDVISTNTSSYHTKEDWSFVNYLDTGNITENVVAEIQRIDLNTEKLPSRAKRKVQHNSIIYSTVRPNQRHYGIIKEQPENFLVSTGFTVIDVDESKVDADFLYYLLSQESLVELLHSIAEQSVSAYPSIKAADIENLEVELPPLIEQKRIASVLSMLSDKIRQNTDVNKNLYSQMITIYNNARESSAWVEHSLGDILVFYDQKRRPLSSKQRESMDHIYPYYGATSIVDYVENYIFEGTYILISEDGAYVVDADGHPLIQYTRGKFWINNHAHIVKGIEGYSAALLYTLIGTLNMQSIVTGAAQPKINQANLRNYKAIIPNFNEAKILSSTLNPLFEMIISNDSENEVLKNARNVLLPKLMSW